MTHYRLTANRDVEIITWLDDHSRMALSVTAHKVVTGQTVTTTFLTTTETYGIPASTLTDNGLIYTARYAGGRGGRNSFETTLIRLAVLQKNSKPNHPTTCGKVERFQQTLKRWLNAQPRPGDHQRATNTARYLRADLQPPTTPPLTATPPNARHRLPSPTKTNTSEHTTNPPPTSPDYATTASTTPAKSPSATTDTSTKSASDDPTAEPPSSSSSTNSTSASSTPTPANSSDNSPSTPPAPTNPPATNKADPNDPTAHTKTHTPKTNEPPKRGFTSYRCLATSHGGDDGNRTHDLFIANEALCQLSYIPGSTHISGSHGRVMKPHKVIFLP